jgi:hypothetical protein
MEILTMKLRIFSLVLIAILAISAVGSISATTAEVPKVIDMV